MVPTFCVRWAVDVLGLLPLLLDLGSARTGDAGLLARGDGGGDPKSESSSSDMGLMQDYQLVIARQKRGCYLAGKQATTRRDDCR